MREETYGRQLYVCALVVVVALSVAGNAIYAYAKPTTGEAAVLSPGWAAFAHTVPPILLLLVTEVFAVASSKFDGQGRMWALAGVVVVAGSAFVVSFDALREVGLMAKVRPELAFLVPVMLDVAVVVCTVLVLMASRQIQRDRAAALMAGTVVQAAEEVTVHAVTTPANTAVEGTEVFVQAEPGERAGTLVQDLTVQAEPDGQDPAEDVTEVVQEAREHDAEVAVQAVDQREQTDAESVAQERAEPAEQCANGVDRADGEVAQTRLHIVRSDDAEVAQVRADRDADVLAHEQGVKEHRAGTVDQSVQALAEAVHAEVSPAVDVWMLAQLITARREGASFRELGELAGVAPNTARKWMKTADELEEEPAG